MPVWIPSEHQLASIRGEFEPAPFSPNTHNPMAKASTSAVSSLPISPVFHDFEPYCEWKRGEDSLIVHVPEFKKEHLRVQVNTSGALKISGERPMEGHPTRRSRFFKETRVPEGCNINHVNAKLCDGKLTIAMPRTSLNYVSPPGVQPPPLPPSAELPEGKSGGKCELDKDEEELDDEVGFGGFRIGKTMAVRVGVAVAAIAAIGAALLVFRSSSSSTSSSTSSSSAGSFAADSLPKAEE